MLSITPCQRVVSDRFPVASFVVRVPANRCFEIVCATDPSLFHPSQRHARRDDNFYTSRTAGLLRAPAGQATYLLPVDQLRRFAGQQRLYFGIGAYRGAQNESPVFTLDLAQLNRAPFVRVSPDFTGRTLARDRLSGVPAATYGQRTTHALVWGGDEAAMAEASAPGVASSEGSHDAARTASAPNGGAAVPNGNYDDGFDRELWCSQKTGEDDAEEAALPHGVAPSSINRADPSTTAEESPAPAVETNELPPPPPPPPTTHGARARYGGAVRSAPRRTSHGPVYGGLSPRSQERYGQRLETEGRAPAAARAPAQGRRAVAPSRSRARLGRPDAEPHGVEHGADLDASYRGNRVGMTPHDRMAPPPSITPATTPEPPGAEDGRAKPSSTPVVAGSRRRRLGGDPGNGVVAEPPGVEDGRSASSPGSSADGAHAVEEMANAPDVSGAPPAMVAPPPLPVAEVDDEPDGEGEPAAVVSSTEDAVAVPLNVPQKLRIITPVAPLVSKDHGFAHLVAVDGDPNDPVFTGLEWGFVGFKQQTGAIGAVLLACQRRSPIRFREVFGPSVEELVRTLTAATPAQRLAPVDGARVWKGPWPKRFSDASLVPQFQAAQREVAIERYLDPNIWFAQCLGIDTDRGLAMVFDRAVDMGSAAARRWIIQVVSPLTSEAEVSAALRALGHADIGAFQDAVEGLDRTGELGAKTHAALLGALRTAPTSTVRVPEVGEFLDRMVEAAAGTAAAQRVETLRKSNAFEDVRQQVV